MKLRYADSKIAVNVMMDGKKTFIISATNIGDIYDVWYVRGGATLHKGMPVDELEDLEVME